MGLNTVVLKISILTLGKTQQDRTEEGVVIVVVVVVIGPTKRQTLKAFWRDCIRWLVVYAN